MIQDTPHANYEYHEQGLACSFLFTHYAQTLQEAKEKGYRLISFKDYDDCSQKEKLIILRHDCDLDIVKALRFAEMESALGARATYFVRLHANEYNAFGFRSLYCLKKILSYGHEVGLHFETGDVKSVTGEDEKAILLRDKTVLEQMLNIKIVSATIHGDHSFYSSPHLYNILNSFKPKDYGFTYFPLEDRFFKEIKYLSDSNGYWREGGLCKNLGKYKRMQVLTHPKWWFDQGYHVW